MPGTFARIEWRYDSLINAALMCLVYIFCTVALIHQMKLTRDTIATREISEQQRFEATLQTHEHLAADIRDLQDMQRKLKEDIQDNAALFMKLRAEMAKHR